MAEENRHQLEAPASPCQRFHQDLSAYLEGEERPHVLAHARECAFCSVLLADMEQVRFTSHHLPLEEPPARLWANIRAMLAVEGMLREPVGRWGRWLPRFVLLPSAQPLAALACLVLFAVTLLLSPTRFVRKLQVALLSPDRDFTAASALGPGPDSNLARIVQEMEHNYLAREPLLDPGLKATYRKSLDSLNAAIEECAQHCRREPGNTLAREYLLSAYQSKAEVLASALEYDGR